MRLALSSLSPARLPARLRGRAVAMAMAIAIELLVIAALLTLGRSYLEPKKPEQKLATFQVIPEAMPTPRPRSRLTKITKVSHDSAGAAPKTPTHDKPATPEPKPETPSFIPLSKDELAAADIGHMASASGSSAGHGAAAYGPGEGPGGERLYNADWVREPTAAEMDPYMPANVESGEADVACRAIPGNRVDNCQFLSETPGSGLARTLRLAAWQFHIRPERINGKPVIGGWIRIHYVFTLIVRKQSPASDDAAR